MDTTGQLNSRSKGQSAKQTVLTSFAQLGEQLKSSERPDPKLNSMVDTIEGEILPRLMLTFLDTDVSEGETITEVDRVRFLDLVLSASANDMQAFMDELARSGVPEELILADLLASAARRLGELWEEDLCDFTDVTLGLCRLHEVLRHASVRGNISFVRAATQAPSVLLTNGPDDQHVFGLLMVAEFFRRDGWHVWSEPGADLDHVCAILEREQIDAVGLSLGCTPDVRDVTRFVTALREASNAPQLKVFLGGNAVLQDTTLAEKSGADGWSDDALTAPQACRALLAERHGDC